MYQTAHTLQSQPPATIYTTSWFSTGDDLLPLNRNSESRIEWDPDSAGMELRESTQE